VTPSDDFVITVLPTGAATACTTGNAGVRRLAQTSAAMVDFVRFIVVSLLEFATGCPNRI
jgi:hypothetical protein